MTSKVFSNLKQEELETIDKLLIKIPEKQVNDLNQRQDKWDKNNKEIFGEKSSRMGKIRAKLNSGIGFSSLTLDEILEDMSYLSNIYFHLVEYEGLSLARYTLFKDCFESNITLLSAVNILSCKSKKEAEVFYCRVSNYLLNIKILYEEAKSDLAVIGLLKESQSSRSSSIKMMIEVYKKRHDSKLREISMKP